VIDVATVPVVDVAWRGAVRLIRSAWPPIDLFEDIADPADWPLLIAAEQKTNPRLMETIGNLDLLPQDRWVAGAGASYLMAPFTHVSPERPSRFSAGAYGVLYVADRFEVALSETIHHHALFMAATAQAPGWTSQFREIVLDVRGALQDLRGADPAFGPALDPDDYRAGQALGAQLRAAGAEGAVYPSQRHRGGQCVGLFYPDLASNAVQGRHLDYHWDGDRVDLIREPATGRVFRVAGS
jgi:hypothetical protein